MDRLDKTISVKKFQELVPGELVRHKYLGSVNRTGITYTDKSGNLNILYIDKTSIESSQNFEYGSFAVYNEWKIVPDYNDPFVFYEANEVFTRSGYMILVGNSAFICRDGSSGMYYIINANSFENVHYGSIPDGAFKTRRWSIFYKDHLQDQFKLFQTVEIPDVPALR